MSKQTISLHLTLTITLFAGVLFLVPNITPAYAGTLIKSTASDALNNGLVGYWNFDEGQGSIAYDRSGQRNDGRMTNASNTPWVIGNNGLGQALKFDGGE